MNDTMNGKGKYTLVEGDVYEGDFLNGCMDGKGKYTHSNGDIEEGMWKQDIPHGTFTHAGLSG